MIRDCSAYSLIKIVPFEGSGDAFASPGHQAHSSLRSSWAWRNSLLCPRVFKGEGVHCMHALRRKVSIRYDIVWEEIT